MSPVKILILKGSPRLKGNSSSLADQLAEGARSKGAEVESFDLHRMNIQACNACDYCQTVEQFKCNIEDDMQILYKKLDEATCLVIACPVYWFTINAQTKLFMDRLYAMQSSSGLKVQNKKVAIILTYGDDDAFRSGGMNAVLAFRDSFRFLRCTIIDILHCTAMDVGDVQKNEKIMKKAYHLGEILAI
jgi:multimeric flavodoxin WrbA